MTDPFDEYGDRLRRALHAEADAVVPSVEGLEQIRTKIDKRRGRRFGPLIDLFTGSWLRPLAAVTGAIFIAAVAVSTTPAIKNFVETGHFTSDNGHDGGAAGGPGHYSGQPPAGNSGDPGRSTATPQSSISPSSPGAHTFAGTCPPGKVLVPAPGRRTAGPDTGESRAWFSCGPEPTTDPPKTSQPTSEPTTSAPVTAPTPEPTPDASGQSSP